MCFPTSKLSMPQCECSMKASGLADKLKVLELGKAVQTSEAPALTITPTVAFSTAFNVLSPKAHL